VKIIIGNKCDLEDQNTQQDWEFLKQLQQENGIKYFKCSARSGDNVKDAFEYLA